jgi:Fe2+ transport system protein B
LAGKFCNFAGFACTRGGEWRLCSGIISGLIAKEFIMEAERLNTLSALLADLTERERELRRYL